MASDPWAEFLPGKPADPWADFPAAKPRAWSDVPLEALKNTPKSAVEFAGNIAHMVMHPYDTVSGLADSAVGGMSLAVAPLRQGIQKAMGYGPDPVDPKLQAQEQQARAVGSFFSDRYGSEEGIKNTLATDPVGALADAMTVVAPAQRLPAAISKATPFSMLGKTVAGVGKVAEPVASNALGFSTGAGADAVRQAARSGLEGQRAFVDNMRGNVPMTDVLDQARGALGQMRQERNAAYQGGMANVRNDATVLDMAQIEKALGNTTGIGTFEGKTVNPGAVNTQEKLAALLSDWKGSDAATYHTPAGLDALKQAVGAIREETQPHTQSRVVADRVYRSIGDTIKAQAPTYADTMEGYANASRQIGEVERTFSLGEKASQDTGMRKLQSVMRNNVNTNFGTRQALAEALAERAPDLKAAIAGQSMNTATPRGLAKIAGPAAVGGAATVAANPYLLALLAGSSPRLVGEGLYAAGRAAGASRELASRLGVNADRLRAAELMAAQGGRIDSDTRRRLAAALAGSSGAQFGGP